MSRRISTPPAEAPMTMMSRRTKECVFAPRVPRNGISSGFELLGERAVEEVFDQLLRAGLEGEALVFEQRGELGVLGPVVRVGDLLRVGLADLPVADGALDHL